MQTNNLNKKILSFTFILIIKTRITCNLILFLTYFILFFSIGKSLNCYECNVDGDKYDSECEKIDEDRRSEFVTKCPDHAIKCGTMVTFGLYDFYCSKPLRA